MRRYPVHQTVIVNTKTNRSFRGVMWSESKRLLVLRNVEMLEAEGSVLPVDGEVVIERPNVDFVQVLGVSRPV